MTTKALLAGIPLGVLATGALVGQAGAATPQPTTQKFDYNLGAPFPAPTDTPTPTPVAIGGETPQYTYQYNYDAIGDPKNPEGLPFVTATPTLASVGTAQINPTIFNNDSLPTTDEHFMSFPGGTASGDPVVKDFFPQTAFAAAAGPSDNYLHLNFDIGSTNYLGTAHFSSDGQTLYDVKYIAADAIGSAVPEPTVWAELILGFGAIGGLARVQRRRRQRDLALAA